MLGLFGRSHRSLFAPLRRLGKKIEQEVESTEERVAQKGAGGLLLHGQGSGAPRRVVSGSTGITVSSSAFRSSLLTGRRYGRAGSGSKIHIVREDSYSGNVYLCGRRVKGNPVVGSKWTSDSRLCQSCRSLAERGAR